MHDEAHGHGGTYGHGGARVLVHIHVDRRVEIHGHTHDEARGHGGTRILVRIWVHRDVEMQKQIEIKTQADTQASTPNKQAFWACFGKAWDQAGGTLGPGRPGGARPMPGAVEILS
jgi:hypothetical protein